MLQLNPQIPIIRVKDKMKGFAFIAIDYSQDHNLIFVCSMNNGEIWCLPNTEIRMQENISLNRTF